MGGKAIERLAKAIGYPDRVPDGAVSFTFRVDGAEIAAYEADGRIVLSCALSGEESDLPLLATWAAGRMLRENAVLAYGDSMAFIWQDESADADPHVLLRLFETFADSCDWWRTRLEERRGGTTPIREEMVIRP